MVAAGDVEQGASRPSPRATAEPEAFGAQTEASDAPVAMMSKINAFNQQREEERKRMYQAVIRVFFVVSMIGHGAYMLSLLIYMAFGMYKAKLAVAMIGHAGTSASIVILSTCPFDMLSIDDVAKRQPRTFVAMTLIVAMLPAGRVAFRFPHILDGICLMICLVCASSVVTWRWLPSWWPETTTFMTSFAVLTLLSWGTDFLFPVENAVELHLPVAYSLAGFYFLCASFVFIMWQLRIHRTSDKKLARGMSFYEAFYTAIALEGVAAAARGVAMVLWHDQIEGVLEIATGFCLITPPVLLMLFGRTRLFNMVGRRFDRDGARLRRDGAFIAELLDNIPVNVGQLWWIHRETEDERYGYFDPRRRWVQGRVAEVVDGGEILVQLPETQPPPTAPARATTRSEGLTRASRRDASFSLRANSRADLHQGPGGSDAPARPSVKDKLSFLARAGSRAFAKASTVRVPFKAASGSGKRKEALLLQAQENLRCVDFESLTPDLMMRVDAKNDPEMQARWHGLSRPVRAGETIDYFMSNSWYDNPDKKWQKLCEVAESHRKRHGHYPTIWLDKLCIDQTSITDGLKALPVNVMACNKLLALCGDTYLSRLWCIWELFTLFAFVTEASALDRIEFVFLGDHEEGMQMLRDMKSFHVKDSHCYDPNEEARLRQVIDAVGTSRFNQRISSLAALTCKRLEQQQNTAGKSRWMPPLPKAASERSVARTASASASASASAQGQGPASPSPAEGVTV